MTYVTQKIRIENMQGIYDHFVKHPDTGTALCAMVLGIADTTARYRIKVALDQGYLTSKPVTDWHGIGDKSTFSVTAKGRPATMPPPAYHHKGNPNPNKESGLIRRKFVKAKQIGMVRDSLVAALFGEARAVA